MIQLRNLTKVYNLDGRTITALKDITLRVRPGEIYGVLGQSGAGKSTLVRCVNLLERPTSGEVWVDGQNMMALSPAELRRARQGIGMIFQHFNLFQSRTVAGNVAYPLEVAGWPKDRIQKRVAELLELVGLGDKAAAYPAQLSGGQKQRVGIARALAPAPKILLSDEATSALDPETTRSVLSLLREINQKLNLTILLITHQMDVVKEICDSAAILENGELVEQGKVLDLIAQPSSRLHGMFYKPSQAAKWNRRADGTLVLISGVGKPTEQPVISTIVRRFDADVNIIEGSVERIGSVWVSRLLVEVAGSQVDIPGILQHLRSEGFEAEVMANVG